MTSTKGYAGIEIARFAKLCAFNPDSARAAAVAEAAERLRAVPEFARKLLAQVIDLAYREHHDGRKSGVAYLPEVYESCGIGVDEMYGFLRQLESAGLVRVEGEYPFQNAVPSDLAVGDGSRWPFLRDLARFCAAEHIPLRDLIVDLHFEKLA